MSLTSIVQEIERRAKTREIGRLQEIRKNLKSKSRLPYHGIFHPDSIKEKDGYAFHYGGRTELQFNVGFEGHMFRHGVAFSFEPSQSLPNIESLIPSVKRFNEFLTLYPDHFSDLSMWHWDNGSRSTDYPPTLIRSDLVRRGVFVFMGRMQPSDQIDYDRIADDLDRLLPLYRFVEGNATFPEISEPRNREFRFESGCKARRFSASATIAQRQLDVYLKHNEMESAIHLHLAAMYGKENVGTEIANAGGLVDVVVRRGEKFWFYEIKTALSARGCIREALAQLLEYSFWPGSQIAEKLIIVGEPFMDVESAQYLTSLRTDFSLPLEYQQFDSGVLRSTGTPNGIAVAAR